MGEAMKRKREWSIDFDPHAPPPSTWEPVQMKTITTLNGKRDARWSRVPPQHQAMSSGALQSPERRHAPEPTTADSIAKALAPLFGGVHVPGTGTFVVTRPRRTKANNHSRQSPSVGLSNNDASPANRGRRKNK